MLDNKLQEAHAQASQDRKVLEQQTELLEKVSLDADLDSKTHMTVQMMQCECILLDRLLDRSLLI